jgi:hypothetical protein
MYPMYSPGQIAVATFIGGPLAAAWLMAVNFRRLGSLRAAVASVAVALFVVFGLGTLVVTTGITPPLGFVVFGLTVLVQGVLQGNEFRSHLARQGRVDSWWSAIGVSIVTLALSLVPLVLAL